MLKLVVCRQLTVVRAGWNNLGLRGARSIAEGLKYSSTLTQLHLPWTGITDTGAAHIAKALESNSSVRLLDMSGDQVSAASCVVLVETLQTNKSLEWLVLQDNPLGTIGARKLLGAVHAGNLAHAPGHTVYCILHEYCIAVLQPKSAQCPVDICMQVSRVDMHACSGTPGPTAFV